MVRCIPINQVPDTTLSKKLNPFLCSSQVFPPTSMPMANVCPSPGTSTISHLTPSLCSTSNNSRLTSIETIASSAPCTINVGGKNPLCTLHTGSICFRRWRSGQHASRTVPLAIWVSAKASREREKSGPLDCAVSLCPSREMELLVGIGVSEYTWWMNVDDKPGGSLACMAGMGRVQVGWE